MKKTLLLLTASLTVGVAVHAQAQTQTQTQTQTSGLTQAEVKQQLVQAEAQGLLPSNGTNYPPSARAIARNKATFAEQHESKGATAYGGVDTQTNN